MSDFFGKLRKLEGAVDFDCVDPLTTCVQSSSPSVNWSFNNQGHGLPFGFSGILFGPPKGGKSIICNSIVGQLHKDDPEAGVISFNTELRGRVQNNKSSLSKFGIDQNRFLVYDTNIPKEIFDRIEFDIAAKIQEGTKINLIIIDSLTGIAGRRFLDADTVDTQQRGDKALTIQEGLLRILPIIRRYNIALLMTDHIRAEQDPKKTARGEVIRMASAFAAKHMAEYFMYTEPNQTKEGRTNLAGEEYTDKDIVDFMEHAQKTAHKIRFQIVGSSFGAVGRTAEFTLDYDRGIINQYEEVFTLAKNLGILERPNNRTYIYKNEKWTSLIDCLLAIRDNATLYNDLLKDIYKLDVKGASNEPESDNK